MIKITVKRAAVRITPGNHYTESKNYEKRSGVILGSAKPNGAIGDCWLQAEHNDRGCNVIFIILYYYRF